SASFVYTTPKKNLEASNYKGGLKQFAEDLDTFAITTVEVIHRAGKGIQILSELFQTALVIAGLKVLLRRSSIPRRRRTLRPAITRAV
ncbi:hypothetical protein QJN73_25115, partial [Escherichia coli]